MDKYEGPGTIQMDSSTLAEATSVRVRGASNNSRVRTLRRGLAGRSKGPREFEITVANAIPVAGMEQDFIQKMIDDADVSIVVVTGGKRYQYDGWIDDISTNNDTDSAAGVEYTVIAGKPLIT
jgi:hypothetical protein